MSCNGVVTLILSGGHSAMISTPSHSLSNDILIPPGALLTFLPLAYVSSWQLVHDVVGYWMLLPLVIGLFAAWLGREENQ